MHNAQFIIIRLTAHDLRFIIIRLTAHDLWFTIIRLTAHDLRFTIHKKRTIRLDCPFFMNCAFRISGGGPIL